MALRAGSSFLTVLAVISGTIAGPVQVPMHGLVQAHPSPTVQLDGAIVTGVASDSTNKFLGIPFAQPPVANLRYQLPQPLPQYDTNFSAVKFGPACPQHPLTSPGLSSLLTETIDNLNSSIYGSSSEDCLTLNVITPTGTTPTSDLPVVAWIYGGAFLFGSADTYDGSVIVEKAVSLDVPVVYVSMNYRLNAFGFLSSQEVKDAGVGNLGLHDQRLALQWVQKYIRAFGGNPLKVTIWGQSAGATSVALQMLTNGGNSEGLFRAAFMQSGVPVSTGDITSGQPYYDALVIETGCSGRRDTLQCLREVPYWILMDAVGKLSNVLFSRQWHATPLYPRVDGVFLRANPQELVQQGSVANIPFITGNCDDEGTILAMSDGSIKTDAEFEGYLRTLWFPDAANATIARLMKYYPWDPTKGSPFNTGYKNMHSWQFKRLAAFLGDVAFQAPRRFFLQNRSGKQDIWAYLSKRHKWHPYLGSYHSSDLFDMYYLGVEDMTSYLVRFVANLDPNMGESDDLYWPQYMYGETENETVLVFLPENESVKQDLIADTYRMNEITYLMNVTLENPL